MVGAVRSELTADRRNHGPDVVRHGNPWILVENPRLYPLVVLRGGDDQRLREHGLADGQEATIAQLIPDGVSLPALEADQCTGVDEEHQPSTSSSAS